MKQKFMFCSKAPLLNDIFLPTMIFVDTMYLYLQSRVLYKFQSVKMIKGQ